MDELHFDPLNKAHFLSRKAARLTENGDLVQAVEFYKQANENLAIVFDRCTNEPVLHRSIELQLIENDWNIHYLNLRMKKDEEDAEECSPDEIDMQKCKSITSSATEDKVEDDVVVIDPYRFLNDSLCPDRTSRLQHQLNFNFSPPRRRSASSSALPTNRNPLMPTTNNANAVLSAKKLPKTEALKEEEILEKVKINQKLAREFF